MALTNTPVCEFGRAAADFSLTGTDGRVWALADCQGERATLVMFICNHCPYVQGILARLLVDVRSLLDEGIRSVAIMPNDTDSYPEDGLEAMTRLATQMDFPFPYLIDTTQEVARAYQAVCTPDFFGYNGALELQYRGRLDEYGKDPAPPSAPRILVDAMRQIADSGQGPTEQVASMGCSIKWHH